MHSKRQVSVRQKPEKRRPDERKAFGVHRFSDDALYAETAQSERQEEQTLANRLVRTTERTGERESGDHQREHGIVERDVDAVAIVAEPARLAAVDRMVLGWVSQDRHGASTKPLR
eukprot:4201065-Prymnesium_polylepis.1